MGNKTNKMIKNMQDAEKYFSSMVITDISGKVFIESDKKLKKAINGAPVALFTSYNSDRFMPNNLHEMLRLLASNNALTDIVLPDGVHGFNLVSKKTTPIDCSLLNDEKLYAEVFPLGVADVRKYLRNVFDYMRPYMKDKGLGRLLSVRFCTDLLGKKIVRNSSQPRTLLIEQSEYYSQYKRVIEVALKDTNYLDIIYEVTLKFTNSYSSVMTKLREALAINHGDNRSQLERKVWEEVCSNVGLVLENQLSTNDYHSFNQNTQDIIRSVAETVIGYLFYRGQAATDKILIKNSARFVLWEMPYYMVMSREYGEQTLVNKHTGKKETRRGYIAYNGYETPALRWGRQYVLQEVGEDKCAKYIRFDVAMPADKTHKISKSRSSSDMIAYQNMVDGLAVQRDRSNSCGDEPLNDEPGNPALVTTDVESDDNGAAVVKTPEKANQQPNGNSAQQIAQALRRTQSDGAADTEAEEKITYLDIINRITRKNYEAAFEMITLAVVGEKDILSLSQVEEINVTLTEKLAREITNTKKILNGWLKQNEQFNGWVANIDTGIRDKKISQVVDALMSIQTHGLGDGIEQKRMDVLADCLTFAQDIEAAFRQLTAYKDRNANTAIKGQQVTQKQLDTAVALNAIGVFGGGSEQQQSYAVVGNNIAQATHVSP